MLNHSIDVFRNSKDLSMERSTYLFRKKITKNRNRKRKRSRSKRKKTRRR